MASSQSSESNMPALIVIGLLVAAMIIYVMTLPGGPDTMDEAAITDRIKPAFTLGAPALTETAAPAAQVAAEPAPAVAAAPAAPAAEPTPAPVATGGNTAADAVAGEATYKAACFACHDTGAAGAPLLGDKGLWAPRLTLGFDTLKSSVLNGKGAMPPKGGAMHLTNDQVANAVAFMIERAQ